MANANGTEVLCPKCRGRTVDLGSWFNPETGALVEYFACAGKKCDGRTQKVSR